MINVGFAQALFNKCIVCILLVWHSQWFTQASAYTLCVVLSTSALWSVCDWSYVSQRIIKLGSQ